MTSFSNFESYAISENVNYDSFTSSNQKTFQNNFETKLSKDFTVQFNENVLISNDGKKHDQQSNNIKSFVKNKLTLADKVQLFTMDLSQTDFLRLVKHNDDKKVIMERLFYNDRKNQNKISFVDNYLDIKSLLIKDIGNLDFVDQLQISNLEFNIEINYIDFLSNSFNIFENELENEIPKLFSEILLNTQRWTWKI